MNAINEVGNKYGSLEVIARDTSKKGRAYWICRCMNCGAITSISGTHLREKNKTKRTCLKCQGSSNTINEIGNQYGDLTVLSRDRIDKSRHVYWKCQCKCGNIISVPGNALRRGLRTKCDECQRKEHPQYIDETGKQYGELTVLKYDEERSQKNAYWICKCSCGNIVSVSGLKLRDGHTQSCGCIKSRGERKISQLLTTNNIKFETQKTFNTCKFPNTDALAKFDFYLPDYNILIEYDGIQHFKADKGWNTEENLIKTQERDRYKNQWCKENNIQLIRIPYTDFNKINKEYLDTLIKGVG